MPEGSPTRELHLPLISFLVRGLNYADTALVTDLTRGMSITGEVPATNALRPRTRVPAATREEWAANIPATNAEVFDRVMAKQGSSEALACWNLPLKEASRGRISTPVPITAEVCRSLPLTPRFALEEEHGLNPEPQIRLIGDFKASGVNSLLSSADTCVPQGLDVFFSMVSFYKLIDSEIDLRTSAEDFSRLQDGGDSDLSVEICHYRAFPAGWASPCVDIEDAASWERTCPRKLGARHYIYSARDAPVIWSGRVCLC